MSREILINVTPAETRVALVENGVPQEIEIERNEQRGLVGNIYKGRVVRVLPGMQAAFIDIGMERAGFLHVDDLITAEPVGSRDIRRELREGGELLVQVLKDPIAAKGARLTAKLSVSSRYLVSMIDSDHIGISQRIEDEAERERLRTLLAAGLATIEQPQRPQGFILRTAAEGASGDDIRADLLFLDRLWSHLQEAAKHHQAPGCVHGDLPLYKRVLRDMAGPMVERILVDSREVFESLREFAVKFSPEIAELLEHYPGERPLFYLHGVEDEIARALQRRVDLKSGGYLVVDQTEAMTTIDVNTGGYVGHRTLAETVFKTNLEAAAAIARQLRMRNLGGIIIIDFIDMHDSEHQRQVLRALEKGLERDRVKTTFSGVTELGLVQLTRKRTNLSLQHLLCEPCPTCAGRGAVKSAQTVSYEVLREVLRSARAYESKTFRVLAAQVVIDRLLDEDSAQVSDLELFIDRTIEFRVENIYSQEQFDIIPV
ncbi:ribonuclease G [Gammaproteobacteria bacterium LSUCC0057]|uniref:Ribonuclease G n=1 Tax=Gammaproteobacteria bacterium LSUCC0057 TaxID=2559237 RepID=A0A4Y8UE83_9GAMM|nr:ribonuclease G [Gammaproteobacteria bacterium LSUCC0057]